MQKLPTNVKVHTDGYSARLSLCKSKTKQRPKSQGIGHSHWSDNNLDAAPISEKRDKASPKVFVINHNNNPLMPTNPRKVKKLLKAGKAIVVKLTPFTIQLTYSTGGARQPIILGVDSGFIHVGLSAVGDKEELFSADVILRSDMVKLNSERKAYRKNRRNRKTWYRKPRFKNRTANKKKGWLAPSILHKLESHKKLIKMVKSILPITKTVIEVASFDVQKIRNPETQGKEYQQGEQLGFWNVREYVLHRDNHKCQAPKCNHKDNVLQVHHIVSRQTGGDRPDNLITLCSSCHKKYHLGKLKLKIKVSNGFKAECFMSMVKWRLVNETGSEFTFGYKTKSKRIELGLPKSHVNDAFVIAGGTNQTRTKSYVIKQVRKCNRKLFKGPRSAIKNTAPRKIFGFQRYDKVNYLGITCFIFGRRSGGYFELRTLDGKSIHKSAKYKELRLLETSKTMLIA